MNDTIKLITFLIDGQMGAFPMQAVKRIIRAVAVSPLPDAPALLEGVINYHGAVIPVFNLRKKLKLSEKPVSPTDRFLLLQHKGKYICLPVDDVTGFDEIEQQKIDSAAELWDGLQGARKIAKTDSSFIFVEDPAEFFRLLDQEDINEALSHT